MLELITNFAENTEPGSWCTDHAGVFAWQFISVLHTYPEVIFGSCILSTASTVSYTNYETLCETLETFPSVGTGNV